jgi:endonuclease I
MKRYHLSILSIFFFLFYSSLSAQIPPGYYDDAEGETGYELKTTLYNIIKNHQDQGYTALWDFFKYADILPPELTNSGYSQNIIWDIYSYNADGLNPYQYVAGQDQCGNYSGEGDCYNREHTFPKSWFNNQAPMKNDAMHILPTDGYVNGRRSNYPYSEVGAVTWTSENGSKLGNSNVTGYYGTAFEPVDEFKGDIARIYFYMATCYQNSIASWENNSSNADAVLDGTANHVFEEWYLDLLVKWHNQDPVSEKEVIRNNAVYNFQNNRNPFVDHPEYVSLIWVDPTSTDNPLHFNISAYPNPFSNKLHITCSENEINEYCILDIFGRTKLKGALTKSNHISTSQLKNGIYFLVVKSTDGEHLFKTKILKH